MADESRQEVGMLNFIIRETNADPNAAIIWMHGLGADGYDFEGIVPDLCLPADAAIRFIFPHAPMMPVTINGGYRMRAWYDIVEMNLDRKPDISGIETNSKLIVDLIDTEIEKGIDSERIFLIGFSQGGVMALHTAAHYPKKLAGAASLSSYLPTTHSIPLDGVNAKIPVFFGHGRFDNVVPLFLGQKAFDFLKENGSPAEMHIYDIPHSVCMEELKTLGKWISRLCSLNGGS